MGYLSRLSCIPAKISDLKKFLYPSPVENDENLNILVMCTIHILRNISYME